MATVQEIRLAEMEKERAYDKEQLAMAMAENASLRQTAERLKSRVERLERCIVEMVLESHAEGH